MLGLGALAFLSPWILFALFALPLLWFLLRATPPAPGRISFPGVRLLLGLEDAEKTPHRTPWWLLMLRVAVASLIILAFAGPVLNPRAAFEGTGPVLIVMDGGWASAPDWDARRAAALAELDRADRADRPVAVLIGAAQPDGAPALDLRPAAAWRGTIEALLPQPWAPLRQEYAEWLNGAEMPPDLDIVWITDGLSHGDEGGLGEALAAAGDLRMIYPESLAMGLSAPRIEERALVVSALRAEGAGALDARIGVFAASETGERRLATLEAVFEEGALVADVAVDLPLELRNQISRVALVTGQSAGGAAVTDESARQRRVGLVVGGVEEAGLRLVSNLHYLRTALERDADVVEAPLMEALGTAPDALFLADVGRFSAEDRAALTAWVEAGGVLVRFAGPRLARGADLAAGAAAGSGAGQAADRLADDPLLPVRLRAGGRVVGGAMAWGEPQAIRDFGRESPFFGLAAPREVTVSRQILARLGPDLAEKTWATLEDGTPLVTAATLGEGRVVLFHVTANAEWSSLPISGLFVDMLGRLVALSGGGGSGVVAQTGEAMRLVGALDGFGRASLVSGALTPVPATRFQRPPGPDAPPGLYAGQTARAAFNIFPEPSALTAAAPAPLSATVERLGGGEERPLGQWFLLIAIVVLCADLVAALWLSGCRLRLNPGALMLLPMLLPMLFLAPAADAQSGEGEAAARAEEVRDVDRALAAANQTVLAYVITGDPALDAMSRAGLSGLSSVLTARTAVEPGPPDGVDLERDDLSLYPVLYWPVSEVQPTPSSAAAARLNAYMRRGGMLVFDTRDAHLVAPGGTGPNAAVLRRLVADLDLPPLAPVPNEHVLRRSFYLLDTFPGRWTGGRVWLQAPLNEAEAAEGLISDPNDGVSPVVIGAADWAAAWAISKEGDFLAPVGRSDGFRQREMAFRFGVNLVMYALTGNYKSDQVHVPALLERLGQ